MVQINFAQRQISIRFVIVGAEGGVALRSLRGQVPGRHDAISVPAGGNGILSGVLRPEGFAFIAPSCPDHPEPQAVLADETGEMRAEFQLVTLVGTPSRDLELEILEGCDGFLFLVEDGTDPETRARIEVDLAEEQGLSLALVPCVYLCPESSTGSGTPRELSLLLNPHQSPSFANGSPEAIAKAFSALAAITLLKLNSEYCSCSFSPERMVRFSDFVFEANLSTGVTQAVLAGDSRPR